MVYIRLTKSSGQFDEAGVSMNEWREIPPARDAVGAELARLTAEITTLRARLETVEAETIERAVKRIKADKDIQGLVKARIFIALRNLGPRHD